MKEDNSKIAKGTEVEKRKTRKTTIVFLVMILVSGLLGGMMSVLIGFNEEAVGKIGDIIQEGMKKGAFYVLPILGAFIILVAYVLYKKQVKRFQLLDEDDMESLNKIEWKLGISISLLSLWTIIACLLYGLSIMGGAQKHIKEYGVRMLISSIFFLVSVFVAVFLQRRVVNFVKGMNPEKKGDVLSMHFQKEWINSCDELEKMQIYKSAYKSFTVMQNVFVVAFALVMFSSLYFNVSAFTYFIVMALWLSMNLIYTVESMKLSRPRKK